MPDTKEVKKLNPKIANSIKLFSRSRLNIPHIICNHIMGKEHKLHHRITVGTIIMACGVLVSKIGGGAGIIVIHYIFEFIGSSLHGIGLVPWIEYISENMERKNADFERNQLHLEEMKQTELQQALEEIKVFTLNDSSPEKQET